MYHVSAQGVDERMINVHYYYYYKHQCLLCQPSWHCMATPTDADAEAAKPPSHGRHFGHCDWRITNNLIHPRSWAGCTCFTRPWAKCPRGQRLQPSVCKGFNRRCVCIPCAHINGLNPLCLLIKTIINALVGLCWTSHVCWILCLGCYVSCEHSGCQWVSWCFEPSQPNIVH